MSGSVGQPIALNFSASLQTSNGSQTLTSITLTGVPASAVLASDATPEASPDGSYALTPAQLSGLTITTADSTPLTLRALGLPPTRTARWPTPPRPPPRSASAAPVIPGPAGPAVQTVLAFADQLDSDVHSVANFLDHAGNAIKSIPLLGSLLSSTVNTVESDADRRRHGRHGGRLCTDILTNYLGDINNIVTQVETTLSNNSSGITNSSPPPRRSAAISATW